VIRNIVRAVSLDTDLYNRARVDSSLNVQAAVVVVVASGLAGFGSAIVTESNLIVAVGLSAVTGLVGWLLWSFVAMIIGTRIFGGTSGLGQMCRVIGFAYAPLGIGVIPWLGFIGAVWVLVAAVIAIREGMNFSVQRSIASMILGWGTWLLATIVVNLLLGWDMRPGWPL